MSDLQYGNLGRRQRLSLALHRPFDRTIERQAQQPLAGEQTAALRYFWWDGIFAAICEAFYLACIPRFALGYGATNQQVGRITAVGRSAGGGGALRRGTPHGAHRSAQGNRALEQRRPRSHCIAAAGLRFSHRRAAHVLGVLYESGPGGRQQPVRWFSLDWGRT